MPDAVSFLNDAIASPRDLLYLIDIEKAECMVLQEPVVQQDTAEMKS